MSRVGALVETGLEREPHRLVDGDGEAVEPVAAYFRELQAANCSTATIRSYGMDLLRWFRFLWAAHVAWDRVSSVVARDFARWLQLGNGRGGPYSPAVRAHSETVLRSFYDFHREEGTVLISHNTSTKQRPSLTRGYVVHPAQSVLRPPPTPARHATHFLGHRL